MDFNLEQWRDQQQESEEEQQQPSAKIPRQVLLQSPHHQEEVALPLFVSAEPQTNKVSTNLSDYPTAIPTNTSRFPRVGGGYCFSIAQWQELELQALIFRHMVAGAVVPSELLQLVKKSLLTSSASPFYLHNYPPHFQPAALLQAGYWGKGGMDAEPGRCKRTDGKKWRCSRDVVAGHKYCERHMHRGRNRSRKPVEFPPTGGSSGGSTGGSGGGGISGGGSQFCLSGAGVSSLDAFQLNQGSSDSNHGDGKSSSKVLMHFFDDWPRSLQESADNPESNVNSSSTTRLSMSTNANSTSDFLRLSTGNGDELGGPRRGEDANEGRERGAQLSWATWWGANPVGSMGGGPLAEVLRSSNNSSPTSVLHQLPRCSASDTSYVST